ncbi:winged helix-turn-helix transcriptional regulator [Halarcobacter ebronensis]|uniref:HxlR family transcriptional regulator n=1 Tax=Halarcobacter ebronensis TaxID=1462615 RepID=A0A4Q1AS43_9BACT|nr:helix-turn-helix domain-containing protein [Halarcobacter ebronensis]QKF80654.1 transcriptional regulator, HxlR family [Halarcobacter ebronensis]RXK08454.1 HxlR family transcriptional regulator [Halarcobacter ebronensis]
MESKNYNCFFQLATDIIGGKWKSMVIWVLRKDIKRNGEIKKMIPDISQKMLTQQLRELENAGVVERLVYPIVPPKVEYKLTSAGQKLIPILEQLHDWGREYAKDNNIKITKDPNCVLE